MNHQLSFYAACLAAYANGRLHGAWIEASTDQAAMQNAVEAMLKASPMPNAEEWAIHDYDGAFPKGLGEYPGLPTIAAWVELIEEHAPHDPALLAAVAENYGEPRDGAFADTDEAMQDHYCGQHESMADYCESYVEDCCDLRNVPDLIKNHIDYESIARDFLMDGYWTVRIDGDIHVFSNN